MTALAQPSPLVLPPLSQVFTKTSQNSLGRAQRSRSPQWIL